jgi:hypothetical protein
VRSLADRGFGDVLASVPAYVVVLALLRWYPDLVAWAITASNALAARFLDPASGLPAWERMSGLEQLSHEGVFAVVYWLASGLLLFGRAINVLVVRLALVAGPLLIVAGAVPAGWAKAWTHWWFGLLLARISVQIFQAFALGAGASLLAGGSAPFDAVWGIGAVWTAVILPGLLPGAGGTGLGWMGRAAQLAGGAATGGSWGGLLAGLSSLRSSAGRAASGSGPGAPPPWPGSGGTGGSLWPQGPSGLGSGGGAMVPRPTYRVSSARLTGLSGTGLGTHRLPPAVAVTTPPPPSRPQLPPPSP